MPAPRIYPGFLPIASLAAGLAVTACGHQVGGGGGFDLRQLVAAHHYVLGGVLVEGQLGALLSAAASVDGQPLSAARIRLGGGAAYRGGAVRPEALLALGYPARAPLAAGCEVLIWDHAEGAAPRAAGDAEVEETRRRLQALGYVR